MKVLLVLVVVVQLAAWVGDRVDVIVVDVIAVVVVVIVVQLCGVFQAVLANHAAGG